MWLIASLFALPLVSAAGPLEVAKGAWNKILTIGNLSFLGVDGLVAFTRILLAILIFAVFFSVMSFLGAGGGSERKTFQFLKRNQAMVIAAVLAIISAIFLPAAAILAVGAGWATAVGLILIGAPIIGLWYVLWKFPGKDQTGKDQETKGTALLKLLISMLLFWILSAMNSSLQRELGVNIGLATVAGTMANFIAWALFIVSIMIIYYIVKFFMTSSENAEEKDKQWQESGEAMRKWVGKKIDDQKTKEEIARRAREVRGPKSHLINAIDACEGLIHALYGSRTAEQRRTAVNKAEKNLKILKKNLKAAMRGLRNLRRKEKGRIYTVFDNLVNNAGVTLTMARNISLPQPDTGNWEAELRTIHDLVIGNIRGVCGAIIRALDAFVELQEEQLSQTTARHETEQQTEREEASRERAEGSLRPRGAVRSRER